jgi:hypothetical protein
MKRWKVLRGARVIPAKRDFIFRIASTQFYFAIQHWAAAATILIATARMCQKPP